ncbi:MAG TPA: type I DNA topoisomerase [bacterium]|nr:type I DNA topoisomerase [bacterium]
MKVLINGEEKIIEPNVTLKGLLLAWRIAPETVVVEHNETVIARKHLESITVSEGDKIEIVRFVGGGADKAAAKKSSSRRRGPRNLVIVESPAKAKTIHKYLGDDYQVEASMGHVRDLPKSKMGVDIEHDFSPHYIVMKKAKKTVTNLKKQAQGKEGIFLAPDPDREGEAISWHLAHIFSEKDGQTPIHRVVFNEITKEAILEAFRHPRAIAMNLVNSQQARRILDRIVGYELSPLLWKKVGKGLSAGRVQSVALRLVVDREREIRKFVPEEYWSLEAKLSSKRREVADKIFLSKLEKIGAEKADLKNREQTEAIREEILKLPFKVSKIDRHERKRKAHGPYTTSKLQQEAYTRLGFPAAKTMRIAQKLYEGIELGSEGSVGLITYMRTDSVNVAQSAQQEAITYVRQKFGDDYLPKVPPVYRSKKGAQEAHEAIRPTSVMRESGAIKAYLDEDEYKLYDLIWRKFVASQMMPAVDEHMSISIVAGEKYFFKTTGRRNLFPGFSIIYSDFGIRKKTQEEDEKKEGEESQEASQENLPELTVGEILNLHELMGYQHFTKPPARFNDASLVKILEEKGIGRPSTYAPTIYTLLSRDYVNRRGGALQPTELGEIVVDLLVEHFPKIMEVEFTAKMEEELDKIEEGSMEWISVLKDFYGPFESHLAAAREEMKNVRREVVPTDYKCDVCGKGMVIRWGRFGKFLACSGFPDCKYTRSIPTGFRCPQPDCKGDLVKRMSKNRRTFYGCSNYPKCTYIANKLPKEEGVSEEEQISDIDRETIGP